MKGLKRMQRLAMKDKRVFLRVDFNVPLDDNQNITSDYRIRNALDTIEYIRKRMPKRLIIATHIGRPHGQYDPKLSVKPVADRLSRYLGKEVYVHSSLTDKIPEDKDIVLLENLRFHSGEKGGDLAFARELAAHADVYVNDAFGTAHRKDASVFKLPGLLPHGVGYLIEHEVEEVHLRHKRPQVAVFGPAKISDKLPVFKSLLSRVDKVILGGGVVFTFLKAGGLSVGRSLVEEGMLDTARNLLDTYGDKIVFPLDFRVAAKSELSRFSGMTVKERYARIDTVSVNNIPSRKAAFDVGPQSIRLFRNVIREANTVIWNGPLGLFEIPPFDWGSRELAKTLSAEDVTTIVCGGDTAAALRRTRYKKDMDHISTGGGASLELLADNKLPGLEVLRK